MLGNARSWILQLQLWDSWVPDGNCSGCSSLVACQRGWACTERTLQGASCAVVFHPPLCSVKAAAYPTMAGASVDGAQISVCGTVFLCGTGSLDQVTSCDSLRCAACWPAWGVAAAQQTQCISACTGCGECAVPAATLLSTWCCRIA